ncbi:hypothetical protein PG22506_1315 [Bifidobacterium pseudolongum subsp. globosum]|uniref:hypothetical protein n=1 Tax=Bifidobacterium TaxID=1678 RepID=UPI00050373CA|nr:hypothetical protein BP20092_02310 [Bifidobacterium pseudolongum subsp. globosum DSM 20092]KFI80495.1 hypothetical protein BPSG_1015 [Bifidobacterium pseudolongum subsp. globosum]RYP95247.1 hypothetical protein PG112206_1348 [Bifidobacterium pseudolongum subsp. globosum]RYP95653.1 hypothetical protein PG102017_1269 [Bifidobacterium pseudolongum subsp. globosum]RYP99118.1 hypothetical protein PG22506_1315 [Bifidobacterium pseudolongum subsp. globosum]
MEQAQGNTGSFNAVEYGPGQAARDAEHDALKTDELTEPRALNTDPLTAAVTPDNAVMPDPSTDDVITGEFTATEAESDDGAIADEELRQFEKRIDDILATGELDETLRVIDAKGVAQVLPVLDSEPISHLLEGIEEIGGRANVFVRTADGIAVLNVVEYSPEDQSARQADDTPTGETPVVNAEEAAEQPTE